MTEPNVIASEVNEAEGTVTENQNNGTNTEGKKTLMDQIIGRIATEVARLARGKSDDVVKLVTNVLVTIAAINSAEWYESGLRVQGTLYLFSEYMGTPAIAKLLVPARIVLVDSSSAIDFSDRRKFATTIGRVLTPGEFIQAEREIATKLRVNVSYVSLSRPEVGLLAEANREVVRNSRLVTDRNNERILFLTQKFDNDPGTEIMDWERTIAGKLFEFERR